MVILDLALACLVQKQKQQREKAVIIFVLMSKSIIKYKNIAFHYFSFFNKTKKISMTAVHMCFLIFVINNASDSFLKIMCEAGLHESQG